MDEKTMNHLPRPSLNIFIAKLIILTLLGTIGGYYLNEQGVKSQEHLKKVKFEQMPQESGFELYKARIFKPHRVAVLYMIGVTFILFAIFGAYELLGKIIAKPIDKLTTNSTANQLIQVNCTSHVSVPPPDA